MPFPPRQVNAISIGTAGWRTTRVPLRGVPIASAGWLEPEKAVLEIGGEIVEVKVRICRLFEVKIER